MTKQSITSSAHFAWVSLAIAAAMLPFLGAQTSLPFVAWLAPIFLLRFSRQIRPLVALPAIGVVMFIATFIALRGGFVPLAGFDLYFLVGGIALAYVATFAIDRLLITRLSGLPRSLVFPLASTAIGFVSTLGNPLGTAGTEAYSQVDSSLLQMLSLTGIWGLVLLMSWLASVVNHLWENSWSLSRNRRVALPFALVLGSVLLFGGVRLAFFSPTDMTVRTAMLAPDPQLNEQSRGLEVSSAQDRDHARSTFAPLTDDLFARSEKEVMAGAKIVVWSEGTPRVLQEDEAAFLARSKEFAKKHGIYLQVALTLIRDTRRQLENRAIMFTPEGVMAWDYHKTKPTPGDFEKPGPGDMPSIDTPYGRIATFICQDDLFPDLLQQAGRQGVDILLMPSSDWRAVAEWHDHVSTFRAIENGVSIVRPTRLGVSSATDPLGRTIAYKHDYFIDKGEQTLVAAVPTKGLSTVYPYIGDSVAYASMAGVLVLGGVGLVRRRLHTARR